MKAEALQNAWFQQAQADAERGVLECRVCKHRGPLDEALTVWKNGSLVFAFCDTCARSHELHVRPTNAGIEVRARSRGPLIVSGR